MIKRPSILDSVVRGIATQASGKIDLSFNDDVSVNSVMFILSFIVIIKFDMEVMK